MYEIKETTDNLIHEDTTEQKVKPEETVESVEQKKTVETVEPEKTVETVEPEKTVETVEPEKTVKAKKDSGGLFGAILYLIGNFFLFNIVFVLLLLPVVTIGTAMTAYFDIVFTAKYDKKHRNYSVKMLLQRFREHLKLSISYFIGYLLVMGFFIAVALVFSPIGPLPNKLLSVLFILMAGILCAVLIYTFPVLAINAVTSDYRAAVYAIQDRDRREAKLAAERAAAENEAVFSGDGSTVASESDPSAAKSIDEIPNDPSHNTEVLTAYMKRFSKVARTETPSREIMKKADTSSSIKYFADEDKADDTIEKNASSTSEGTQNELSNPSETANTSENSSINANTSEFSSVAETASTGAASITANFDELPEREDRNSLSNVLLDSIYFAAKHFVGLMFTICLYILPGLIIYIFYEDTVILVAGLILIGLRIIMGINARIYYGSFFEYEDELLADEETGDKQIDDDFSEPIDDSIEITFAEEPIEVSVNTTDDSESIETTDSSSDENNIEETVNVSEDTDTTDNSSNNNNTEEESSTENAADRIRNIMDLAEKEDSEEDPDEDLDDEEYDNK